MKNLRAVGLLVLAVIIGLVAAVYAAGWASQQAAPTTVKLLVAAVDVEMGSKVTLPMLTSVDWPSGATPPGSFTDIKTVQDRVTKVSLLKGEPFLEGKLAPSGTQGGLSAVISDGKRAMTVRVNDVVGVAGFALPGNYVDVMVNAQQDRQAGGADGRQISKTVLEHVLVLAVAQEAGRDDTKPKVVNAVTLELTLEDSEKLDLARNVGTLSLVLRNQVDTKTVRTAGITKQQLFGEADPKPVMVNATRAALPAPVRQHSQLLAPPANCVEVIQNGVTSTRCF